MENNENIKNEEEEIKEQFAKENAAEVVSEENTTEVVEEKEPYNGPTVTTTTKYDFKTMKYFNMYNMVLKKHFRIVYLVFGLICFAFGGWTLYSNVIAPVTAGTQEFDAMGLILPLIPVLFGAYFVYESICFEKVIDKNITSHFLRDPRVLGIDVTVTEEDVTMQVKVEGSNPINYNWAYITEIVELPEYYFLFVQKQPIIIEKDPNKVIDGEYSELVRIIEEKTKTKPYKKIEKELVKRPITFVHQEENNNYEQAEAVEEEKEEETESEDNNNQE